MNKTEQAGEYLLGAMLINPEIISRLNKLNGYNFPNGRQAMIFVELRQMYRQKMPISLVSVKYRFLDADVDKLFEYGETDMVLYLMELEENVPYPYKITEWRATLLENDEQNPVKSL